MEIGLPFKFQKKTLNEKAKFSGERLIALGIFKCSEKFTKFLWKRLC